MLYICILHGGIYTIIPSTIWYKIWSQRDQRPNSGSPFGTGDKGPGVISQTPIFHHVNGSVSVIYIYICIYTYIP